MAAALVLLMALVWPVSAAPQYALWIDLPANAKYLTDQEAVDQVMAKARRANIDTVILDVKAYTGYVGFASEQAPHIAHTRVFNHRGAAEGFDLLAAFLKAAEDCRVYASINVFSEANVPMRDGPLFSDPRMQGWESVYLQGGLLAKTESGRELFTHRWNEPRSDDEIVLYSRQSGQAERTPTNPWGAEAVVVNGKVQSIVDRTADQDVPAPMIPDNGFILSGVGEGRQELLQLEIGEKVTVDYDYPGRLLPSTESSHFTGFVNPILPEVQEHVLDMLAEILAYDVDGIVLDRARYANVLADFSPYSREQFERFLGRPVANWPQDILFERTRSGGSEVVYGPLASQWFLWRAQNIYSFVERVAEAAAAAGRELGVYVGSWYNHYYAEGVNWGRRGFQPDYHWADPGYDETGYADLVDFLMAGAYYYEVEIAEAERAGRDDWQSVEGSLDLVEMAVGDASHTMGSLYLLDYRGDVEQFKKAVGKIQDRDMGVMFFDLYYVELYDWWDVLEELLQ